MHITTAHVPRGFALLAAWLVSMGVAGAADQELTQRASWSIPTSAAVRRQLDAFLENQAVDAATRAKIDAMWGATGDNHSPSDQLQLLAAAFALVDDQARDLVRFCDANDLPEALPDFALLADAKQPALVRNNLRLLLGQWLAQHRYYDEALATLEGLAPTEVVDPAALLFYQAAGYHRMPDKKQCLPIVAKLLENEAQIPRRYATVAHLIQADLQPLKVDSIDEISRLMDEVERRLDLRRAGKRVQDQEDAVVAKLDKLIKKMEDQAQSASAAGTLAPSSPAQDSKPLGGKGQGDVDPKSIGTESGWGNLPPKERQEALQQIGKDLPAHYREVIEEYFRKLAREAESR